MLRACSVCLALAIVGGGHGRAQSAPAVSLASAKPPIYPLAAQAAGTEGLVMMKATIDQHGNVVDLQLVGGPLELQQAAVNAVYQWKYHPYTDNGFPVSVRTTITVRFTMGNKKQKAAVEAKAKAELGKLAAKDAEPPAPTAGSAVKK